MPGRSDRALYENLISDEYRKFEERWAERGWEPDEDGFSLWLELQSYALVQQGQRLLSWTLHPGSLADTDDRAGDKIVEWVRERHASPVRGTWEDPVDCGARLRALARMSYSDYLLTPEWAAQRAKALRRAAWRCQACGCVERLNVHHSTYKRRGDERPDDLIVLCWPCHSAVHKLGGSHRPKSMR